MTTWEAPGPGRWDWDRSHFAGAPTPLLQHVALPQLEAALAEVFASFGAPVATFAHRLVNGRVYRRLVPLVGGSRRRRPPPPVMWLGLRVHPELRRRTRRAQQAFATKAWRADLRAWHEVERDATAARNRELQAVDPATLDQRDLAHHLRAVADNAAAGYRMHFRLRGADAAPIGELLLTTAAWGIDAGDVIDALAGSSPAVSEAATTIDRLAAAVGDRPLRTFDDVRATGSDAAKLLDEYLDDMGWRLLTGYDVDGRVVREVPEITVAAIDAARRRNGTTATGRRPAAGAEALRARVPAAHRARLDDLLAEAQASYGLRDDNGPLTVEWPMGLLRRAVVEQGRRLAEQGRLDDVEHACELSLDELCAAGAAPMPAAGDVARRAADRAALAALEPPTALGPEEPDPPAWVFPKPIAHAVAILRAAVEQLEAGGGTEPLAGAGVGTDVYRGRARVAESPHDALGAIEPGDVLVAPFTTPAYNVVLGVAGAVVCEEGGLLSHAAITARELGIPAVVGASGAMAAIPDGAIVEVDARAGRVRIITP